MNVDIEGAITRATRLMLARRVVHRTIGRSLTRPERGWVRDGWVPATLATPEVRDD